MSSINLRCTKEICNWPDCEVQCLEDESASLRSQLAAAEHRAALVESEHTSKCDGFNCAYCNFMRVAGELNEKDRELEALRPHIAVIAAESDGLYDAFKHRKAMEAFKKHLAAAPAEEDWCGKLIPWAEKICGLRAGHDGRCTAAPADGEPT